MTQGTPTRSRRVWLGAALVAAVLVLLAVASVLGRPSETPGAPTSAPVDATAAARVDTPRRQEGDPLALGRVDAPVVIAEWGDFQCPYCSLHATRTEPELLRRYVDSGLVRIEWHDYAYLGPESVVAAQAARAAGRQGRFWEFHGALYGDGFRENSGNVTDEFLTTTARGLGLDVARFDADRADPEIARAVSDDLAAGTRVGVTGVPSFVLVSGSGGTPELIFGAQPLPTFEQAIDAALARAR